MGNYFQKLLDLMDTLRGPEGCPWDKEQTRETLKPLLVEEAFEVLEALDGSDSAELCEELGDLLFQVIFHSRIAQEKGEFDIHDVCRRSYEKMVRRHPHVFGDEHYRDSAELL
ncbi:MAG: MazG nucleotide pyrophosphohydrolase domain-containing protein, partial [Acidobacteriota bacterium]